MDDRRFRVLCSGLLVKSPVKSKTKAHLPMCWKARWCVLTEVTYETQEADLLLYYYQNEERFRSGLSHKGFLNIKKCMEIRSCYESLSGFDHLFSIECANGTSVKFSAPSCKVKLQWVRILYYYKYRVDQAKPEPTGRPQSVGSTDNLNSIRLKERKYSHDSKRDSGAFSISSIDCENQGGSLQFRSRSLEKRSEKRSRSGSFSLLFEERLSIFDCLSSVPSIGEMHMPEQNAEEDSLMLQKFYSDLFMVCEACNRKLPKKKTSMKRKISQTKRNSLCQYKDREIEAKYSKDLRLQGDQVSDTSSIGSGSSTFSDPQDNRSDSRVSVLSDDDEWFGKVKKLLEEEANDDEIEDNMMDDEYVSMDDAFLDAVHQEMEKLELKETKESLSKHADVSTQGSKDEGCVHSVEVKKDLHFETRFELDI